MADLDAERVWEFRKQGDGSFSPTIPGYQPGREGRSRLKRLEAFGRSCKPPWRTGVWKTVAFGRDLRDRSVLSTVPRPPVLSRGTHLSRADVPSSCGNLQSRSPFHFVERNSALLYKFSIRRTVQVPFFKTRTPPPSSSFKFPSPSLKSASPF